MKHCVANAGTMQKEIMNKKEFIGFIIIMLVVGTLWLGYTAHLDTLREQAYKDCKPLLDISNKLQCTQKNQ